MPIRFYVAEHGQYKFAGADGTESLLGTGLRAGTIAKPEGKLNGKTREPMSSELDRGLREKGSASSMFREMQCRFED